MTDNPCGRDPLAPARHSFGVRWLDTALDQHAAIAFHILVFVALALAAPKSASAQAPQRIAVRSPLTAEEALRLFQVDPGLRVELVAAEPLVQSPCALAWDERGRMLVVENRGYPTGAADGKPAGRIALLEDTDADGRMDKRTDFATGLTFPNGLLPWNGGLIVTCAPDVLFLKDTNDDGRADVREVWLTGFDASRTTQLRVSHPTLGPDGWIYLTSGWAGENSVRSPKHPERAPVKFSSDSRFHPDTLEIEPVDGRSQFGQSFDDYGNRFTCFNRVHIQHVVISSKWLQRNPSFAFSETIQNVPETMVSDLINGANQNPAARIYPVSRNITTADSHAGQFSAACAGTIYRGNELPAEYYANAFACDPTGNLVHRDILTAIGPTFSARPAIEGREFLASPDNWFRPVNLAAGPDGALYICDLYRKTIEHPEYLPEEVRKRTDFGSGRDKGRIWRVVRENGESASPKKIDLGSETVEELVGLIGHSNVWHRDTARRLLLERKDAATFPLLLELLPNLSRDSDLESSKRLAADPPGPGPHLGRINALDMLFALGGGRALVSQDKNAADQYFRAWLATARADFRRDAPAFAYRLLRATMDESPGVRRAAFRIFTAMPGQGPDVSGELLDRWADDPNPAVRFQVALYFGKTEWSETLDSVARIARRDGANRWTRAAILGGLKDNANYFFEKLMRQTNAVPSPEFMRELCKLQVHPQSAVLALTDPEASARLFGVRQIRGPEDAPWQIAALSGLSEGLRGRAERNSPPKLADFTDKQFGDPPVWKADGRHLRELLQRAETMLLDREQTIALRGAALALLLNERGDDLVPSLIRLLDTEESPELQQSAARGLASLQSEEAIRELLALNRWRSFSPNIRGTILNSLLARPTHAAQLLSMLEDGSISPMEISRSQRSRLLKSQNPELRSRAEKLFAKAGGDRMNVFEEFKSVLAIPSDSERGRAIFKTHCASCHRLEQEGVSVGPDIFGMRNQPKEAVLLHVLVPNHEVNTGFTAYEIETRDGRTLTGLVASETAASITLRQAQGIEETLRRADIVSLRASAVSLMPDEFEKAMSRQELADLLAFLKGE